MNINYNILIIWLKPYLLIILIAYLLNAIIFHYLPKNGVEYAREKSVQLPYTKYDGYYSQSRDVVKINKPIKPIKKKEKLKTLSSYKLKAIYSTTSNNGWISIENKSGTKSYIISQNEELDGYLLVKLFKSHVVFRKNNKDFKLAMKETTKSINYEIERSVDNISEKIIVQDDNIKVKRPYLNSYVNNIDKVWKDISIKELRKDGKIDGFKINRVNRTSVFAKLGLRKGDIIKEINNSVLKSYADAFRVYNNINKTKYLNMVILRNNQTLELNYEID
jgi:general secretion pathway protein C